MKKTPLVFAVLALVAVSVARAESAAVEITTLLREQSAAWNRGDIEGFMRAYAQTDDLRFASGATITLGWRPTLARYRQRYPDKATMGTLVFSEIAITELAPDAAIAFGRWQLTRAKDAPHGLFTLTLKKTRDGWHIIHDHTSSAP
jgi:ketosteroid isomerase-like protein